MSLEVTIEHGGIGVLFTYRDVLEGEAAIAASVALYTPENLKKMHYQVADWRDVTRIEITSEQIYRLAEADRAAARAGNGLLIASVVGHGLHTSISRFYRTYVEDPAIEAAIFKTMDDARQWLKEKLLARGIDLSAGTTIPNKKLELPSG